MSEQKPITDWGDAEVLAMFSGLPEGAMILRTKGGVTVANVRDCRVDISNSYEDDPYSQVRHLTEQRHTMTLTLKYAGESESVVIERRLPEVVNIQCADIEAAKRQLRALNDAAQKIGLR